MQVDMHYYSTYAIARIAGIDAKTSQIIGTCAQYVDDANALDSDENPDQSLFRGIATAHSMGNAALTSWTDSDRNRQIWVPFHFLPGGQGDSFEEKIICGMDSPIAQQMMDNHVMIARKKPFGAHLMGVVAHVYMDTFSHYGFSGFNSRYNDVKNGSIKMITDRKKTASEKLDVFKANLLGQIAEMGSLGLGHGGVATFPDYPWIEWEFEYQYARFDGITQSGLRDNPSDYFKGCQRLLDYFSIYAGNINAKFTAQQEQIIKELLNDEGDMEDRIEQWILAVKSGDLFTLETGEAQTYQYNIDAWEAPKDNFHELANSSAIVDSDIYKFFQAAVYHRWYVLKDLLPSHHIIVL